MSCGIKWDLRVNSLFFVGGGLFYNKNYQMNAEHLEYSTLVFFFVICGASQSLVTIYFHCLEKSNVDILINLFLCFPLEENMVYKFGTSLQ